MTQKAFIEKLRNEGYSYKIEGDSIVVTHVEYVNLKSLNSLPPGVEFMNKESVRLQSLKSLPPGVEFKNGENVYLESITSLTPGVVFKNGGFVYLESLTSLSPGVEFRNKGDVYLGYLIGGWLSDWNSNIEGIDFKRLLNVMIKQGVFI